MDKDLWPLVASLLVALVFIFLVFHFGPIPIIGGLFLIIVGVSLLGWSYAKVHNRIAAPRMKAFIDSGAKLDHPQLLRCFNDPIGAAQDSGLSVLSSPDRTFAVIELGHLNLNSGHVVVADFIALCTGSRQIEPLIETFSPGNYPVQALIVRNSEMQAIAAVRVIFGDLPIDHLEPAWTPRSRSDAIKLHRLHHTDPEGGVAPRTALMSQEAYGGFVSDLKERHPKDFSPEPAFDLEANIYPRGRSNSSGEIKETVFANGTNMFVFHNGVISCECCPDDAYFYLAKDTSGVTQNLILDFGTLGKARWDGY